MMMVSDVSTKIRCSQNIPFEVGLCMASVATCRYQKGHNAFGFGRIEGRWQRLDDSIQKFISYSYHRLPIKGINL